jgi:hypothetical protein
MDRLVVHKHVFAREVYSPMEGGCQDPGELIPVLSLLLSSVIMIVFADSV